jgi:hypothetical protein
MIRIQLQHVIVYDWDGVSYNSTGLYTNLYTDVNGCDSIVNLRS